MARKAKHLNASEQPKLARQAVVCGLALLATASCVPESAVRSRPATAADLAPMHAKKPPPPIPLLLKPVAPTEAMQINAAIPIAGGPNPRATSIVLRARTPLDQMRSLDCLAEAIYYEARSETEEGQRAVAQVVLNRLRHPTYPSTVCGVVYQGSERITGCQFSFTCDGSLRLTPAGPAWARARRLAAEALAGRVYGPVGYSTHYHTVAVLPYWASSLAKSAVIGAHIFYRWSGHWGRPTAFRQHYAGVEPGAAALARATTLERQAMLAAAPTAGTLPLQIAEIIGSAAEPTSEEMKVTAPPDALPKVRLTELGLPQSTVREQFRSSGTIRERPLPQASAAAPTPTPTVTGTGTGGAVAN